MKVRLSWGMIIVCLALLVCALLVGLWANAAVFDISVVEKRMIAEAARHQRIAIKRSRGVIGRTSSGQVHAQIAANYLLVVWLLESDEVDFQVKALLRENFGNEERD